MCDENKNWNDNYAIARTFRYLFTALIICISVQVITGYSADYYIKINAFEKGYEQKSIIYPNGSREIIWVKTSQDLPQEKLKIVEMPK